MSMQPEKRLKVEGKVVAEYNATVDVLFLKMLTTTVSRKKAISLISEMEKTEFRFVSDMP